MSFAETIKLRKLNRIAQENKSKFPLKVVQIPNDGIRRPYMKDICQFHKINQRALDSAQFGIQINQRGNETKTSLGIIDFAQD